jgi:hypothetical protein
MIWTRENLKSLLEKNLCLEVLIPLFRAMGYSDVRYYHGGSLEQGKDIVMWKHDELKGRVNYAVVVKAEKITGSAAIVAVVAFQAQQALGSTFVDEVTQEAHPVHEVLIITSHEITKEGHESLKNASAGTNSEKLIHKIDGDKLWNLVEHHLPHETIFSSFADATRALEEMDPDFSYIVETSAAGTKVIFLPKQGGRPAPVVLEPRFPDTPDGKEQEAAFRRLLSGGQQAEVRAEYLTVTGVPKLLSTMIQRNPDGIFTRGHGDQKHP